MKKIAKFVCMTIFVVSVSLSKGKTEESLFISPNPTMTAHRNELVRIAKKIINLTPSYSQNYDLNMGYGYGHPAVVYILPSGETYFFKCSNYSSYWKYANHIEKKVGESNMGFIVPTTLSDNRGTSISGILLGETFYNPVWICGYEIISGKKYLDGRTPTNMIKMLSFWKRIKADSLQLDVNAPR